MTIWVWKHTQNINPGVVVSFCWELIGLTFHSLVSVLCDCLASSRKAIEKELSSTRVVKGAASSDSMKVLQDSLKLHPSTDEDKLQLTAARHMKADEKKKSRTDVADEDHRPVVFRRLVKKQHYHGGKPPLPPPPANGRFQVELGGVLPLPPPLGGVPPLALPPQEGGVPPLPPSGGAPPLLPLGGALPPPQLLECGASLSLLPPLPERRQRQERAALSISSSDRQIAALAVQAQPPMPVRSAAAIQVQTQLAAAPVPPRPALRPSPTTVQPPPAAQRRTVAVPTAPLSSIRSSPRAFTSTGESRRRVPAIASSLSFDSRSTGVMLGPGFSQLCGESVQEQADLLWNCLA